MPKFHLTAEFETIDELRAYLNDDDLAAMNATQADFDDEEILGKAAATPAPEPTRSATDVDADGMPYNDEVHANPPSFTADGKWRAKRGYADQAKAARAAFLASGGDVTPPAELPTEPAREPEAHAPSVEQRAPAAPALPDPALAPVTVEQLFGRLTEMMESGTLDGDRLSAIYNEFVGETDPEKVTNVLMTNESARANMWRHLESL